MLQSQHLIAIIIKSIIFVSFIGSVIMSFVPVRINKLHVPNPVLMGDNARIHCGYELGNETLYAVKWYKNMREFFRYVPASDTPLKVFPQVGIRVDISKSDKSTVYLRNLSMDSFGNYTCQVSTDKPYFRCVQTTRQLEVIVPPSDGPILMTEKSEYELGENVSILCNSGKSKPAPELQWYINGQLAQSEPSDQETVVYPDQLESTSLVLKFRLKPGVLHNGKVVLKCVASINHIRAVSIKEIRALGSKQPELEERLLWGILFFVFLMKSIEF